MPVPVKCGQRITRKSRDGTREITPTLSYTCELDTGHDGPCASPSDLTSAQARQAWEAQDRQDKAVQRHQSSGLGMTQSVPMSSASIIESDLTTDPQRKVGRPHPSQEVDCPFCAEKPMAKDFINHVKSHQHEPLPGEEQARDTRRQVREKLPMPPPSRPPMAPGPRRGDPEPFQGITTVEDSRVVEEEPVQYLQDPADEYPEEPLAEVVAAFDQGETGYTGPRSRLNLTLAVAILDAHLGDQLRSEQGLPDVVWEAWDHVKQNLF